MYFNYNWLHESGSLSEHYSNNHRLEHLSLRTQVDEDAVFRKHMVAWPISRGCAGPTN